MGEKEIYCKILEDSIGRWNRRIEELEAALAKADGEQKEKHLKHLQELHRIGEQMKAGLCEIRKAEDHEWQSLKERADQIRAELEKSVDYPISRMR